jgi:predicted glycoside hydrolase/deacetylase ChbG (UPF0249 family)
VKCLIVHADDYGLTEGHARAILQSHRRGIVTSTSVLAVGPAFHETAPWLLDAPTLGVGVHLAAVGEDPPLLTASEVPTLVDRRGRFPLTWRSFLTRMALGAVDPGDLRREFTAQLEAVRGVGLQVAHLDCHQHLQVWPSVNEIVLALAVGQGVGAVRIPRSRRPLRRPAGLGVNLLALSAREAARTWGVSFCEASLGFDEAGGWDVRGLLGAIRELSRAEAGPAEIVTHPGWGVDKDRARYAWGYHWGRELSALCDVAVRGAVRDYGLTLVHHGDLANRARPAFASNRRPPMRELNRE